MGKTEIVIARRDVLLKLLQESGLSKRAFSEQFGFSEGWVGGILRDGRIKPQTARMIANRYGIPYDALVEVPDSPVVKGTGLTSLEVGFVSEKIDEALKLIGEVKEMIAGAR